jgi:hypothetical protein
MKLVLQIAAGVVLGWLIVTGLKLTAAAITLRAASEAFKPTISTAAAQPRSASAAPGRAQRQVQITPSASEPAPTPKAYRWKDRQGKWHISDEPPAAGTSVEVIPIEL